MANQFDIVIIGSGLVGASLAIALAEQDYRIAMIEAVEPKIQNSFDYDGRAVALSHGSSNILNTLDIWPMVEQYACAIEHIHVSDKGRFGFTRMNAAELDVDYLGHVVEMHYLQSALNTKLEALTHIQRFCPAKLSAMQITDNGWQLSLEDGYTFDSHMVVAADGVFSTVRQLLDMKVEDKDYGHNALVCNIGLKRDHGHVAYERFTPTGPVALLPMIEQRAALVWTMEREHIAERMEMEQDQFLAALQKHFGYRLGRFTQVGKRFTYPLIARTAETQILPGLVLLGNAAHTLHPIAGQGFNLSLRDVAILAELLANAGVKGSELSGIQLLEDYMDARKKDQKIVMKFTDGLVNIFTPNLKSLSLMRNLGLVGLDLQPGLKRTVAKYNMGFGGKQGSLIRGLAFNENNQQQGVK